MSPINIMMCMKNTKIISEETIKPSSPTPRHLRTLKLSFLDQIATSSYVPVLFFYAQSRTDPNNIDNRSSLLKKSLSETLTRYYPLAGRLVDNSYVDCDDVGVQFLECSVQCKLSDVTSNPNPRELRHLLPFEPFCNDESSFRREALLAVRATFFECGGLVVGVCVSHKLGDGHSTFMFLNDWADTCARADDSAPATPSPVFDGATYFPPRDLRGYKPRTITKDTTEKNIVTKRFVLDKSNILDLKNKAIGPEVNDATRVEAVSAFLWQRIMAIMARPTKAFAAIQAINLRPRMDPPLPMRTFANLWWRGTIMMAAAPSAALINGADDDKKGDNYYRTLVSKMRGAIKRVDRDYIKTLQSDDGQVNLIKDMSGQVFRGDIDFLSFTSWVSFQIYGVDFGWGRPSWVFNPTQAFKNLVTLMGTSDGEGIEAWVTLVDIDMDALERDVEFLSNVSSSTNDDESA